jgi:hypothetical protein
VGVDCKRNREDQNGLKRFPPEVGEARAVIGGREISIEMV